KYEVTNEQFARFVKAAKSLPEHPNTGVDHVAKVVGGKDLEALSPLTGDPLTWKKPFLTAPEAPSPRGPVVQVTVEEARAYCEWARLELPSEAQWVRAASWDAVARRLRAFPWGDEVPSPTSGPVANLADEALREIPTFGGVWIFEGYRDGAR